MFYPFELFSKWFSFSLLNLQSGSVFGEAINFFIYDNLKIIVLLLIIIFIVSFTRSYLPPEKIKKVLTNRFSFLGNILAALIGIITPFCSCSAIPLFIGFVESGVPLGTTFSYLISAPMINEVAIILLIGLFGWKIALIYIISGLLIAVIAGYILGKMKLEHLVEDYVWQIKAGQVLEEENKNIKAKIKEAWIYTRDLVLKIFPYILLGLGIGAFIHGYAPENFLTSLTNNFWAVPVAVLIGIPLYSNAAGIIPIVKSLIEKGLPLGTSLSFMMAVTALSLPEMIILRKVLKPKLLAIYIGILAFGIILTGYLFNLIIL